MPSERDPVVWLNGRLVPEGEARISPFDHGFTVGNGAFETLVTYRGRLFAAARHWRRLRHSCEGLGLEVPPFTALDEACAAVIAANSFDDARLRVTITAGRGPLGSARIESAPTVVVAAAPKPTWPPVARVVQAPWPRNERGALAGLKTTSYAENVVALAFARSRGADEAIFLNTRDELCEGTGSNVFFVKSGILHTPPRSSGCLAGVTRALTLELACQSGIVPNESPARVAEWLAADEAFLTSTTREIQPIGFVNDQRLPDAPGPITMRLLDAWRNLVASDACDP